MFVSTPLLTTLEEVTGKPPREVPDNPADRVEVPKIMLEEDVSAGVAVPTKPTEPYLIE